MRQYQQVTVSGFIQNKKEEVLLVKRSSTDDFLPGLWELPGGGTDFGEHPLKALVREIKEEIGLDIAVCKPLHVDDYFMPIRQAQGRENGKKHRVEIFFACSLKNNNPVVLSHEHSEYKWVGKHQLLEIEMTDYTKKAVEECFTNI